MVKYLQVYDKGAWVANEKSFNSIQINYVLLLNYQIYDILKILNNETMN